MPGQVKRKRHNNFSIVQEGFGIRKMQVQQERKNRDQIEEMMDRISQLPDHIIHLILSLLRSASDVARTSVLSKRWRESWYSFCMLIFDERKFAAEIGDEDKSNKKDLFKQYVHNSLQLHLQKNVGIQKLVLHMISWDSEVVPDMDSWLNLATEQNIKELDLHVEVKKGRRYTLPQSVLSSKTLTGLRLYGCKLENCNNLMLPRLQKLYLRNLYVDEDIIRNLISSCPSIEDLRLIQCHGLKEFKVSNLVQLNRVEIHHCIPLRKVEINSANLHTFWFCGKKSTPCKVNLAGCKSLKRLTLDHPQVTQDFCENFSSSFPLLEKLDLSISCNLTYIVISNPMLQRLVLKGCKKLVFALINAPNLVSLEYKGQKMPFIEIYPFSLRDAKLSFQAKCKTAVGVDSQICFPTLRKFIRKFDPEGSKLVVRSKKNIVIHENLGEVLLPPLPDLSIDIIRSSVSLEDIVDSLLRTWHPETFSIISPLDSKFPQLVYEKMKNREEEPYCCRYIASNNKCWQHFLKDAEFEDFGDVDNKRNSIWLDWLKSLSTTLPCPMTNLRLYWNTPQRAEKQ